MDNLIQLLGDQMSPDVMKSIGGVLGADEATTQKGLTAALPAIIGMMSKTGSSEAGAGQIMDLMTQQANASDGLDFGDLAGMLGGSGNSDTLMKAGMAMLPMLLGGRSSAVGSVTNLIGSAAGLKGGMASSLLRMLAPIALNFVMRRLRSGGNMNAGGLMDMMKGQSEFVEKAAPKGLLDIFDGKDEVAAKQAAPKVAPPRQVETKKSGGGIGRFTLPLILAALAFVAWQFMSNRGDSGASAVTTQLCGNFDSLNDSFAGLPAISADTEVAGLTTSLGAVGTVVGQIGEIGGSFAGVDTLVSAYDNVEGILGGISGTTLGDRAPGVEGAIKGLRDAGTGVVESMDCN